jgi:multiple sugar transport system ATP-binding protein
MVFQSYALYPHMTVEENMGFALRLAGVGRSEIAHRVAEAAAMLDLQDYLGRRPKALSGGQRQRVAMGRAIVRKPQVFLMDEPLSNLDAKLRVQTRTQIAALQRRLGTTTVYVTHDQVEAMTMGDRVAVLKDGVLMQCDTPAALYERPANVFVAGFIGSPAMNVLTGEVVDGGVRIGTAVLPVPRDRLTRASGGTGRVTVGFRPECLELDGPGDGIPVVVDVVEQLGSDAYLYARVDAGHAGAPPATAPVVVRTEPRQAPDAGQTVWLRVRENDLHLFDPVTQDRVA